MRDYQVVSPSLEGVLIHDSLQYGEVRRPVELLKILDGVSSRGASDGGRKGHHEASGEDKKALEDYFHDLYAVFIKRLSYFFVQAEVDEEETVKLTAMLQEMVKVKRLIAHVSVVE